VSKVIQSTSTRWPGSVTITTDPSWEQIDALESSFDIDIPKTDKVWYSVIDRNKIPAVIAWVEKWELQNFPDAPTDETFPRVPRVESHKLVDGIMREIMAVYNGAQEIPNE